MHKPRLNDRLADRLRERLVVFLDLGLKTQVEIAALVETSVKTINNWKRGGFTLEKARRFARCVGISERFFTDPVDVFSETDPLDYLAPQAAAPGQRMISFSGRTTHALASFLEYNAGLLDQTLIRIAAFGTPLLHFQGHQLMSQVAGYQRSLIIPGIGDFGGTNAVIEDFRIARLEVVLDAAPVGLKAPNGSFPSPSDDHLHRHGEGMTQFLLETRLPLELVHVCARMPGPQTFAALMQLMDQHRRDFVLMECALDALKAISPHFVLHTADAVQAHVWVQRFITQFIRVEDAAQAVCYAIEALPFCAFAQPQHRHAMTRLTESLLSGRGPFSHVTPDMRLAADVARAYLPFVTCPEEFEHVPFAFGDSAPGRVG